MIGLFGAAHPGRGLGRTSVFAQTISLKVHITAATGVAVMVLPAVSKAPSSTIDMQMSTSLGIESIAADPIQLALQNALHLSVLQTFVQNNSKNKNMRRR